MTKFIKYQHVCDAVEKLCIDAAHELPEDVLAALRKAITNESNPTAKLILEQLLENAAIAQKELIPLCQDTGLAVVFIEHGANAVIDSDDRTIIDAINDGVAAGYKKGYLRGSVVAEPLNERKNTQTNTPCIIHHEVVSGDKIRITLMAKGGGCENKSAFRMFNPTAGISEVADWVVQIVRQAGANACPPFIVGVGIGGNFEVSCLLSKKALLRKLDSRNSDTFYSDMERDILTDINKLGIGPQGLGGDTTALGCLIETAPCHIASLPVAVNIECHSHRHRTIVI